jgi:hypothetical protein
MSHVRFFHGSTDGEPYDIYFGSRLVASNLSYGHFTDYSDIRAGDYPVSVYYSGRRDRVVYSTSIRIPVGRIYTYTLSGVYPRIYLVPVIDSCRLSAATSPCVRFVQLSPDCPCVDVACSGRALWSGCNYQQITSYSRIYPGSHTITLYPTGTVNPCLTTPRCTLLAGRYYTFYTYGSTASVRYPLRMHIPIDGHSYLRPR